MTDKSGQPEGAALSLAKQWVQAVNARDVAALERLFAPDSMYSGMALTPPEQGVRWGREMFCKMVARGGGSMRKPVIMTVVGELDAGDRAVIECEGYGERPDGGVYANVYALMFWTRDGQITKVHDYCCTATAAAHFKHLAPATADPT
jgi:ketosteroid isomerase-like protein